MKVMKKGKRHSHSGEKKKNKRYREQNLDVEIIVATQNSEDGVMYNPHCKAEEIQGLDGHRDSDTGAAIKPCRSKKDKKKRKEVQDSPEKEGEGCNQVERLPDGFKRVRVPHLVNTKGGPGGGPDFGRGSDGYGTPISPNIPS
ncbi:hypothetical protein JHK86_019670 [Glycine max]|nr:hypothetical protein JHK86_019670 [Glycine max]